MADTRFRLVVTGAAGFIGSHTVDAALAHGCDVLALDDLSTGREANLADAAGRAGFAFERGDVADAAFVDAKLHAFRPDAVVHLAGLVSVQASFEHPDDNHRRNVLATEAVARAALAAGCTRVVFSSSAAVYADDPELPLREPQAGRFAPLSPYGAAKRDAEQLLAALAVSAGLSPVVLRYFNVYGTRQDPASPYSGVVSIFLERARRGLPLVVHGDGAQTRDFVAVADVVRANLAAADPARAWPGPCNVCTGTSVSLLEFAGALRRLMPALRIEPAPARAGDIAHSLGDPSRLRDVLGAWRPIAFAEGLAALLATSADP
jgi:UDP-glucose 4-epimerase